MKFNFKLFFWQDFDRTLASAQANLAGLFPPTHDDEKWHNDLLWQPIPGEFRIDKI